MGGEWHWFPSHDPTCKFGTMSGSRANSAALGILSFLMTSSSSAAMTSSQQQALVRSTRVTIIDSFTHTSLFPHTHTKEGAQHRTHDYRLNYLCLSTAPMHSMLTHIRFNLANKASLLKKVKRLRA